MREKEKSFKYPASCLLIKGAMFWFPTFKDEPKLDSEEIITDNILMSCRGHLFIVLQRGL